MTDKPKTARHETFWSYIEPRHPPADMGPVTVRLSEAHILAATFAWWSARMRQAGKAHLISEDACIADFVTVHWACRS